MADPAFALTHPADDHQEAAFLAAWKAAIKLTGHPTWFGVHTPHELDGHAQLHRLAPRVPQISKQIREIPQSQAALVAAMVGLFNPAEGAALAAKAATSGLGTLVLAMNERQRQAVCELITHYKGW